MSTVFQTLPDVKTKVISIIVGKEDRPISTHNTDCKCYSKDGQCAPGT